MGASDHPLFLGFVLCILLGRGPSGVSGCQGAPAFVPARLTQPPGLPKLAVDCGSPRGSLRPALRWAWQGQGKENSQVPLPSRSRFPHMPVYSNIPSTASTPAPGWGNLSLVLVSSSGSDRQGTGQSGQLRLVLSPLPPPSPMITELWRHQATLPKNNLGRGTAPPPPPAPRNCCYPTFHSDPKTARMFWSRAEPPSPHLPSHA